MSGSIPKSSLLFNSRSTGAQSIIEQHKTHRKRRCSHLRSASGRCHGSEMASQAKDQLEQCLLFGVILPIYRIEVIISMFDILSTERELLDSTL
ncbi:hypothetical protein PVAG01_11096 [Phlyctema vagabunda]|uniref:Uncharacterized protein n=1 Tax=Phlyctema vagabunda TaxID=108571 RepID=A0ABR4P1V8_9HELO